jgi:hypothetical protein
MVSTGIGSVGGGREELDTATNGSHIWESVFQIDGVSLAAVQNPVVETSPCVSPRITWARST